MTTKVGHAVAQGRDLHTSYRQSCVVQTVPQLPLACSSSIAMWQVWQRCLCAASDFLASTLESYITILQLFSACTTKLLYRGPAEATTAGHVLNEVFEQLVEEKLQQPTFVMDHPLAISPLAKPHRSTAGCVERWELFIAGIPLSYPLLDSLLCFVSVFVL